MTGQIAGSKDVARRHLAKARPAARALLLAVTLACGSASATEAAAAEGEQGKIAGKLKLPRGWSASAGENLMSVRAVDAESAELAAVERPRNSRYSLKVSPGLYVVVAQARAQGGRGYLGASDVVKVRAGKRVRGDIRLRRADRKRSRRLSGHGRFERRGPGGEAGIRYFGVDPGLVGGPWQEESLWDSLGGALAGVRCPGTRVGVIETHPQALEFMRREIRLHNSGAVDPSTVVKPNWIDYRFLVLGEASASEGNVAYHAEIIDRTRGEAVASFSDPAEGGFSFQRTTDFGRGLAAKACFPLTWEGVASGHGDWRHPSGPNDSARYAFDAVYKAQSVPAERYEHDHLSPEFDLIGEPEAFYELTMGAAGYTVSSAPGNAGCEFSGSGTATTSGLLLVVRAGGDPISSWPSVYENTELRFLHQLRLDGRGTLTATCPDPFTGERETYTRDDDNIGGCWQSEWETYDLEYDFLALNRTSHGSGGCGPDDPGDRDEWSWGASLRAGE